MNNFLSLGLGVQSTALYYMSSLGELPAFDMAIFVDLGKEKKQTYEYLDFLQKWRDKNDGLPIVVVKRKNLYLDLLNSENSTGDRFGSIPAYTKNEDGSTGMLRRQCTYEYKIQQVDNYIQEDIFSRRPKTRRLSCEIWKGISTDEIERLKIPEEIWKTHVYPFCNYSVTKSATTYISWGTKMSRIDIVNWYISHGLPIPPKSSCVFCPYTSEFSWKDLKDNHPEDFAAAVMIDRAIRDSSKKGSQQPIYLHESCQPLEQIRFKEDAPDLWHGECSGECHT